jgi:type IV secretory pathway VirD2 relaxase
LTKEDLIREAFYLINGFKRSRALEMIEKEKGNRENSTYQKLKQYELIDRLELSLRAIQKEMRGTVEEES